VVALVAWWQASRQADQHDSSGAAAGDQPGELAGRGGVGGSGGGRQGEGGRASASIVCQRTRCGRAADTTHGSPGCYVPSVPSLDDRFGYNSACCTLPPGHSCVCAWQGGGLLMLVALVGIHR
jgi:hypothetical protein